MIKKYSDFFGNKIVMQWTAFLAALFMLAGVFARILEYGFSLTDLIHNILLASISVVVVIAFNMKKKELFKGLVFALCMYYLSYWLSCITVFENVYTDFLNIFNQIYFAVMILGSLIFFVIHCAINTSNSSHAGLVKVNQKLTIALSVFCTIILIGFEVYVAVEYGFASVGWTWFLTGLEGIAVLNLACCAETFVEGFRNDRDNGEPLPIDK